jgi:hypothetical protein
LRSKESGFGEEDARPEMAGSIDPVALTAKRYYKKPAKRVISRNSPLHLPQSLNPRKPTLP